MADVFHGASKQNKAAAMSIAYSMAAAAASRLPEGVHFNIVIEGCDPDPNGEYTASARLVVITTNGTVEAPQVNQDKRDSEEADKKHNRDQRKEDLRLRLLKMGVNIEGLEEDGLDLDRLTDIFEQPIMHDVIIAEWAAAVHSLPEKQCGLQPYAVPDIPPQAPVVENHLETDAEHKIMTDLAVHLVRELVENMTLDDFLTLANDIIADKVAHNDGELEIEKPKNKAKPHIDTLELVA